MPSWGAPAKGLNAGSPSPSSPVSDLRRQSINTYQQSSPYRTSSSSSCESRLGDSFSRRLSHSSGQSQSLGGATNFSSDNPFQSQARFSADNPFHNTSSESLLSSENPYSPRDISSPIHQHVPRPSFQPSPLGRAPGMRDQPRFSPRTPSSRNFNTQPSFFHSPSPRYQTPPNRFQSGFNNRGFNLAKKGFGNRNGSFSNPGGSDDIHKYVNASMLEDPWRDLPATPLTQTY
ncbi:hypothetical protein PoB_004129700 [Plakobranchus ocellatus]|uniref:Uncharacterized protein n=1 Tax=Plakobranchus ocellatus TaxID=259542 RepID=A0AAV4B6Q3_9GAST|nr:hypothetical protein PoB_004129700 [Plakobranchus ocellatus]